MWVKANLVDDGIELLWQVRTKVINGNIVSYDANGNIESLKPISRFHYSDSMKSAGIVNIDDDFADFCGVKFFNDMVVSIMRHMVNMVVAGYGEDPEEIVEWYSDIKKMKFLDGAKFRFDGEYDPFCDMIGLVGVVSSDDNGEFIVNVNVRDNIFEIPLNSSNILISFIISTTPV